MMMNIGGGIPGVTDRATHGSPAKFSFCVMENEEQNPWEPLHVERGCDPWMSAVTVIGAHSFQNINSWIYAPVSEPRHMAQGLAMTLGKGMASFGTTNSYFGGSMGLVLNPEHALLLQKGGFQSKASVKQALFEHAQIPISFFHELELPEYARRRPHLSWNDPQGAIPVVDRWEDILIIVAGGGNPAYHAVALPTYGSPTTPVTKTVLAPNGRPAKSLGDFR
jgi:hypothetical protein